MPLWLRPGVKTRNLHKFTYEFVNCSANVQTEKKTTHSRHMYSSSATSFTAVNGERATSGRQRLRDSGQSSGLGELPQGVFNVQFNTKCAVLTEFVQL